MYPNSTWMLSGGNFAVPPSVAASDPAHALDETFGQNRKVTQKVNPPSAPHTPERTTLSILSADRLKSIGVSPRSGANTNDPAAPTRVPTTTAAIRPVHPNNLQSSANGSPATTTIGRTKTTVV